MAASASHKPSTSPSVKVAFQEGGNDLESTLLAAMSPRSLSDVPEEGSFTPALRSPSPRSPYNSTGGMMATGSTSAFTTSPMVSAGPRTPQLRKPTSLRNVRGDRSSREPSGSSTPNTTLVRRSSSPTASITSTPAAASKPPKSSSASNGQATTTRRDVRNTPRLPHDNDIEPAPSTLMYWSRAPVYGMLPLRSLRAHSVNLVDNVAWLFGGCDDKGSWKDVYCFDTETMQWSHPDTLGDIPPPCRAHTATLVDRKIVIFGGGQGPIYYNSVFVLDTLTRRWQRPSFNPASPIPTPRRAHTAVYYRNKIWVFGGGNGMQALNDVWTLDVGVPVDRMRWEEIETRGRRPAARGYHTANLIGNVMVVVGGSDGKDCFFDIWCLNLDTLVWSQVKLEMSHRRLSHTATQVGSYLFIMGGHDGTKYTSELLMFNLVSLQYEPKATAGRPPSARGYHCALLADSRLFVFGGFDGHSVFDDVFVLDLAGAAYLPQVTSFRIDV